MSKFSSLFLSVISSAFLTVANADVISFPTPGSQAEIVFHDVSFAGNGCSQENTQVASFNGKAIILVHPDFSGSTSESRLVRKSCSVRIPINMEEGYQVALQATSAGRASISEGVSLSTRRELFLAGGSGEIFSRDYVGEQNSKITVSKQQTSKLQFSKCGGSAILAMNLSAVLKGSSASYESNFRLDNTRLNLVVRKCIQ